MALASPGVEVTIIDQSQYLPAASNSVPLLILATAQNKANAAGTGVAPATTKANANKLYQITSQRDLVNLYGNPFFYKTTTNTPIQGYELNEYGLLAAYSLLGSSNRCFILRADIDLAGLVGQLARPTGAPADGTYWLDTSSSDWGIYEWNTISEKFVKKDPIVITDSVNVTSNVPKSTIGNQGDYAVVAIPASPTTTPLTKSTYFYKNSSNQWVQLGSKAWLNSVPTIVSSVANPTLVGGDIFSINVSNNYTLSVTVPASPNNNVAGVAGAINANGLDEVYATVVNGVLQIYSAQTTFSAFLQLTNQSGTPVDDLGLRQNPFYYQNTMRYGTSAQMPLWGVSQSQPRSTGSVWIKTTAVGNGVDLVLSEYSESLGSFISKTCDMYPNTREATYNMDSSGGQSIPPGTTFARYSYEYGFSNTISSTPIQLFQRLVSGPTVVTGTTANPVFPNNTQLTVGVSIPGSTGVYGYTVSMPTTGTLGPSEFVTAWTSANIPYTTATVTTDNAVQLSHTVGGDIFLYDANTGVIIAGGFQNALNSTVGPLSPVQVNGVAATGGGGAGAQFNVSSRGFDYILNSIASTGSGYSAGDALTINGVSLGGTSPANDLTVSVVSVGGLGDITGVSVLQTSVALPKFFTMLSNWTPLTYIANEGRPANNPLNGTNWFYSTVEEVDIMVNYNGAWRGYRNLAYDASGFPSSTGSSVTDPKGPICTASEPTTQSDGTPLVYGDLWLDTNELENYPVIHRWQRVDGLDKWVLIDNKDQINATGIVFTDARWGSNGSIDPVSDPIPTIASLLTSNYVDLDCPSSALYPQGMMLFNTRRSGYNVKQFKTNYFTSAKYPAATVTTAPGWTGGTEQMPISSYTWVSASGLKTDGSPYMGRKAQRNMVVQSMKAAITTNMTVREEDTFFNLIAAPNYTELQPEMVALNNERNNTAYIIGDTPLRLEDQATAIQNWATNSSGASSSGEDGWVTRNEYMGVFYPSGITTDLSGAEVVVPASHMMLRTFLRNDSIAYPWLAAAGTRRGTIDNALNIGYLDAVSGEFQVIKNRMSLRDVLYLNQINPLAFFTGVGLLNYGNKNSKDTQSAMDRTNVARLVAYIRERLQVLARPFVFEPNDSLTRSQITGVVQSLFIDLVAKRGLYDYLVVCDTSNNTPARIDRNELWIDIAIEPVKAAEFIYVPVRILNTGALSSGG